MPNQETITPRVIPGKTLYTRIKSKVDYDFNWDKSELKLLDGEIGVAKITVSADLSEGERELDPRKVAEFKAALGLNPTDGIELAPSNGTSDSKVVIGTAIKIGNGKDLWKNLPLFQAYAGDVYEWAKKRYLKNSALDTYLNTRETDGKPIGNSIPKEDQTIKAFYESLVNVDGDSGSRESFQTSDYLGFVNSEYQEASGTYEKKAGADTVEKALQTLENNDIKNLKAISKVKTNLEGYIKQEIGSLVKLEFEVVTELPARGVEGTIYLVYQNSFGPENSNPGTSNINGNRPKVQTLAGGAVEKAPNQKVHTDGQIPTDNLEKCDEYIWMVKKNPDGTIPDKDDNGQINPDRSGKYGPAGVPLYEGHWEKIGNTDIDMSGYLRASVTLEEADPNADVWGKNSINVLNNISVTQEAENGIFGSTLKAHQARIPKVADYNITGDEEASATPIHDTSKIVQGLEKNTVLIGNNLTDVTLAGYENPYPEPQAESLQHDNTSGDLSVKYISTTRFQGDSTLGAALKEISTVLGYKADQKSVVNRIDLKAKEAVKGQESPVVLSINDDNVTAPVITYGHKTYEEIYKGTSTTVAPEVVDKTDSDTTRTYLTGVELDQYGHIVRTTSVTDKSANEDTYASQITTNVTAGYDHNSKDWTQETITAWKQEGIPDDGNNALPEFNKPTEKINIAVQRVINNGEQKRFGETLTTSIDKIYVNLLEQVPDEYILWNCGDSTNVFKNDSPSKFI